MKNMLIVDTLLLLLLVTANSCIDRDLCYDHAHMVGLEVKFDWSQAPEATPSTMVVHFFTADGKHSHRFEFTDMAGGNIRLEAGKYMMLFHNGEMETVRERGDSWSSYELFTLEEGLLDPMSREMGAPPRPSVAVDEPVRFAPEKVWGGHCELIEVRPGEEGQTVTLLPKETTDHYTVELHDVKNLSENLEVSAALSGMSESYSPGAGRPSGTAVTLPLELKRADSHTLTAHFVTFGHCPDNDITHILSIYTSEKVYYNFDVTEQMHDAPDPHNIKIEIEGISLPTVNSGMTPSVDDWNDNVEDIYIKLE